VAIGGERLLGEVEPTVHGADDVEAGHREGNASGQLLGEVGPAADHVDERRLALAYGAQDGVLGVVVSWVFVGTIVPLVPTSGMLAA
jgi:hypothetical protein